MSENNQAKKQEKLNITLKDLRQRQVSEGILKLTTKYQNNSTGKRKSFQIEIPFKNDSKINFDVEIEGVLFSLYVIKNENTNSAG